MQLNVGSENDLEKAASKIIEFSEDQTVWVFYGEMGSGKTTLIKEITKNLDVEDNAHSPSFSIVNEYGSSKGAIFYHFDFYRIKNEIEAMDIGLEEYLESGNICFIEWPEKIRSLLPENYLKIEIRVTSDVSREVNICHYGR